MKPKVKIKTSKTLKFPAGFLWGAATSSYQVEGGISNNDWATTRREPPAGLACDHYHRYEEDFRIAKKLHHNAHRLSLEWSRIEPERDVWDENEIHHYFHVLENLKHHGFTTFVTLQHLTLPAWFSESGGMANQKNIQDYGQYVAKICQTLGQSIDFWVTINEPSMHALMGYGQGMWPPFRKSRVSQLTVYRNLLNAHNAAYDIIHAYYPHAQVGFANGIAYSEPAGPRSFMDNLVSNVANWASIGYPYTRTKNDFLGVNYYFHNVYQFRHLWVRKIAKPARERQTDKGWEIYPNGLYEVLQKLAKYNKPIYVTENGIADGRDQYRAEFILSHLRELRRAIANGVPVWGYFYWSLLDNYEWPVRREIEKTGYEMKFGLVAVDFEHGLRRTVRPSAKMYAQICKTNAIPATVSGGRRKERG